MTREEDYSSLFVKGKPGSMSVKFKIVEIILEF
jgi:hypothetical protein